MQAGGCFTHIAATQQRACGKALSFFIQPLTWLTRLAARLVTRRDCNQSRHFSTHPAAIARRDRQAAAERGHRNRQQTEALRRRAHRFELLATMEGK